MSAKDIASQLKGNLDRLTNLIEGRLSGQRSSESTKTRELRSLHDQFKDHPVKELLDRPEAGIAACKRASKALAATVQCLGSKTHTLECLKKHCEDVLTSLDRLCEIIEQHQQLHRIRQHIINLDRTPRGLFDHRALGDEWKTLASMCDRHVLPFFSALCRARQANQMQRDDLVLHNVREAFVAAFASPPSERFRDASLAPADYLVYVSELYDRLTKTFDDGARFKNCKNCKHRQCNHIADVRSDEAIDLVYRAELMKDVPQVFELLATFFFNRATKASRVEDAMEYAELALHSVFLGLHAVVPKLRDHERNWSEWFDRESPPLEIGKMVLWEPPKGLSPGKNLFRAAHLLRLSRAIIAGIWPPSGRTKGSRSRTKGSRSRTKKPLYCCHYEFERPASGSVTSGIPDSRRRSALHLVLVAMRVALVLLKRSQFDRQKKRVVANSILDLAENLEKVAKRGKRLYQMPIWMYPFAGDACLYIARCGECGDWREISTKGRDVTGASHECDRECRHWRGIPAKAGRLGETLHRCNVDRVVQEYDPHAKRNGTRFANDAAATIDALLDGNNPPPRRDGNIVYSLTRIARAREKTRGKTPSQDDLLLDSLLDELRFEFDAMFWSSMDKESRFLERLSASSTTGEMPPTTGAGAHDPSGAPAETARCPFHNHQKKMPLDRGERLPKRDKAGKTTERGLFSFGNKTKKRSDGKSDGATPTQDPSWARHVARSDGKGTGAAPTLEMCILRSWSSFTPYITQDWREGQPSRQSRGGGYLLRWRNVGIAIDPGPGFVANLQEAGLSVTDVHIIFLTHNHPDHFSDLIPLLTLAERKNHTIQQIYLAPNAYRTQRDLMLESFEEWRLTHPRKANESPPHRQQDDIMSQLTHPRKANESPPAIRPFCHQMRLRIGPDDMRDWSVVLEGVSAVHDDIGATRGVTGGCDDHRHTYGLLVDVHDEAQSTRFRAFFTSDTAWTEKLGTVLDKYLSPRPDVVVAHVSKVEFRGIAHRCFYHKHLGVLGCAELIKKLKPRLAIISEWGEEYSGYRGKICSALERAVRTEYERMEFRCVPGDRGMQLVASLGSSVELRFRCNHRKTMGDQCLTTEPYDQMHMDRRLVDDEERVCFLCKEHRDL